jgi:uncharacterized glyoxalase superfamily metalloenzyme YdcJ
LLSFPPEPRARAARAALPLPTAVSRSFPVQTAAQLQRTPFSEDISRLPAEMRSMAAIDINAGRVTRTQRTWTQPRLALTKREAAASLGISVDSFERYVQSDLRVVRRGSLRLFPVGELERWLEMNAAQALGG